MKKLGIEIKWALIFLVAQLGWMFLERITGLHGKHIAQHTTYTNLFAIIAILVYVFAIMDKRKNYYHGVMTYMQGFTVGLIITFIVTLFNPLIQYISLNYISPDYLPNITEYGVKSGKMTQEAAEIYFSMKSYIIQGIIGALLMGVVTSAIVAIFFWRKKR